MTELTVCAKIKLKNVILAKWQSVLGQKPGKERNGGLIFMAEKIVDEMAVHLEQRHPEHLSNVLYVNFHGLEVQKECTELAATGQAGKL